MSEIKLEYGDEIPFPPRTPDDQIQRVAQEARDRCPEGWSPAALTEDQSRLFSAIRWWPERLQKAMFEEWGLRWVDDGVPVPPPVFFNEDEF